MQTSYFCHVTMVLKCIISEYLMYCFPLGARDGTGCPRSYNSYFSFRHFRDIQIPLFPKHKQEIWINHVIIVMYLMSVIKKEVLLNSKHFSFGGKEARKRKI